MPTPTYNGDFKPKEIIIEAIAIALDTTPSLLDIESSFVGNGGDSLSSIRLQAILQEYNMQLSMYEIFAASSLVLLATSIQPKAADKSEDTLIVKDNLSICPNKLSPQGHMSASPSPERNIYPQKRPDVEEVATPALYRRYPMTEMQVCLIRSSKTNSGRNIISWTEKYEPEQIPLLRKAWEHVLKQEHIFNVSFHIRENEGWMYEKEEAVPFPWEEVNVTDRATYCRGITCPPSHDLNCGFSFKVVTYRHPIRTERDIEDESTVVFRFNHVLIDCVSGGLVLSKVRTVLANDIIQPGLSFPQFALQLKALQLEGSESAKTFWSNQAMKYPFPSTELLLPTPSNDYEAGVPGLRRVSLGFAPERLAAFAKRIGVTTASLFYTAWAILLARYSGSNNIVLGAVLSGRNIPIEGVQSVVGPLINTLPLYVSLDPKERVIDLARRVFTSLLELTSFQWSTPDHGYSRNFSVAVNVLFPAPNISAADKPTSSIISDFPIQVDVESSGHIHINFDTEVYYESHMHRLAETLATTLDTIQQPGATNSSCFNCIIGKQQLDVLADIGNWASSSTRYACYEDTLVSLFDRAAIANANSVAVTHCCRTLTYFDLHEQSTRVAQHLMSYVQSGDVVCVHADGTFNWIVAIYAVLKAGAIYCPIDPSQPDAVRSRNLSVASAKLFLAGSVADERAMPTSCRLYLSVEELLQRKTTFKEPVSARAPQPGSIAYICLTSGSTGVPKAVQCRHVSLVAFQTDLEVRLCARPGWRIAQFLSPAFDGSIHEIFSALSYGATLVLKDSARPFEHLKTSDAVVLTPSVAKVIHPEDFPNLQTVYLVGEAVPQVVCDTWASRFRLFNMYGPTEGTCGATIKQLTAREPVTLGGPTSSARLYVLDSQQRLTPWGVIGEIFIAGVQVAAGYAGQPEETSKRFLSDTINPQFDGEFMYKTGDRAFWDERGELVFLGRQDREIKLRGFRINLDDLEMQLKLADRCCTAVAVTRQEDHLVALVQPADLDLERFIASTRSYIATHARPQYVLAVKSFPTNKVGKLDYNAIAAIKFAGAESKPGDLAQSVSERMVAGAVQEVLGLPTGCCVDGDADLGTLGINSIEALSLARFLSRLCRQRIPVRLILESATVRALASTLVGLPALSEPPNGSPLGDYGVSPIESEWWYKYQRKDGISCFNLSFACELPGSLDKKKLALAWNTTLARHRILRCRYRVSGTRRLVREYASHPPVATLVNNVDVLSEANVPFDLAKDGDIARVMISQTHMLVIISHIICDLTTLQVLLEEVAKIYQEKELPPVRKTYAETVWAQPAPQRHLSFWTSYLLDAPHRPFSLGRSNTARQTWAGASHLCSIPREVYKAMLEFTVTKRVTMHQLALATVTLALYEGDKEYDVTLGAPYLNRNSEDMDVVGLFLEPLPIRIRYQAPQALDSLSSLRSPSLTEDTFLDAVKRSSTQALSHAIPWNQLLTQLGYKLEDNLDNPFFDTMVTFHEVGQRADLALPGVRFIPTHTEGAKFKLMTEFTAYNYNELVLRLEYSTECFAERDMIVLESRIRKALRTLIAVEDSPNISYHMSYLASTRRASCSGLNNGSVSRKLIRRDEVE